jgi:hypothetical protein
VANNVEKASRAAEKLAEAKRDSYQTVVDHAVGLQERNVRFAQGVVDGATTQGGASQAESNRAMTQELVERVEKQRDAYQTLVEQSLDAYMNLAYAPLSYYKEGLQGAKTSPGRRPPRKIREGGPSGPPFSCTWPGGFEGSQTGSSGKFWKEGRTAWSRNSKSR